MAWGLKADSALGGVILQGLTRATTLRAPSCLLATSKPASLEAPRTQASSSSPLQVGGRNRVGPTDYLCVLLVKTNASLHPP